MLSTPLKVLLFLAGASGAAGGTAYVAGAFDPYLGPSVAVSDAKISEPAAKPAPAAPQAAPAAPDQKLAATTPNPEKPAADPAPVPPSFDLLRVEPDGSMVIAGSAMAGSSVEVLSGSKVLAKVQAGPSGAFAAILDNPLKPGDYQVVLRSTGPGNLTLNSVETAVVSVPAAPDGEVLALVEQPGAPSKLITVPDAKPEPKQPADTAAPQPAPAPAASATADTALKNGRVSVEAVEIEGRKIFVAGAAPAGQSVRVYANEILLGEIRASSEGRYLIETERGLKVGDYIVRADVLGPSGNVVARAAVPFEREAGESVAAVAPPSASAEAPPGGSPPATPSSGAAPAPAGQTPPVTEGNQAAPANLAQPESGQQKQAAETTAPKLESVSTGVIIRRGDSLWRISKRVYGRGMRYSTIYLANKEQITDPNMIWPGQIFRVPDQSDKGEKADMKAIGEQATTVE